MRNAAAGLVAGLTGTMALEIAGYVDMAVRNRPASQLPSGVVAGIARAAGANALADDERFASRRAALGALAGYANGAGLGVLHGVFHHSLRRIPWSLEGFVLAIASSATTDVAAARTGATNLSEWSPSDWRWDFVFHAVYGLATAAVLRAIATP